MEALDSLGLMVETFPILNGDGPLLTDFFHKPGNDLPDNLISIGRDSSYVLNLLLAPDFDWSALKVFDHMLHGKVDASP